MNAESIYTVIQPHKSLVQNDWGTAIDNVYSLPVCKGVELSSGATSGVLEIHLLEDPDDKWYLLPLSETDCKGRLFNKIRTVNTTVVLSAVTCFPL